MGRFKPKIIQHVEYAFDHLEPFRSAVNGHVVEVHFSLHCFTETAAADHTPDLLIGHQGEIRAFSLERYMLSKQLPGLIRSLPGASVYYSQQFNYFFVRQLLEIAGPYVVFFTMAKAKRREVDTLMHVRSAYCKPQVVDRAAPVRFATLVEATALGRPIKRGPFVTIKRK